MQLRYTLLLGVCALTMGSMFGVSFDASGTNSKNNTFKNSSGSVNIAAMGTDGQKIADITVTPEMTKKGLFFDPSKTVATVIGNNYRVALYTAGNTPVATVELAPSANADADTTLDASNTVQKLTMPAGANEFDTANFRFKNAAGVDILRMAVTSADRAFDAGKTIANAISDRVFDAWFKGHHGDWNAFNIQVTAA